MVHSVAYRVGQNKYKRVLRVLTSSIMDQFKEIPLLESLLNFQKDACKFAASKCYHFILRNGKQCKGTYLEFCKSWGQTQWQARA